VTAMADGKREIDRREFLGDGIRIAGAVGLGGLVALRAAINGQAQEYVWQIDPDKCIACDKCQTLCVLDPSAVKSVQCFQLCGYCDVCTGYFPLTDFELSTAAENQLCPTEAIRRNFIEAQAGVRYFEYTIDEELCIGCGKCVKGCELMNGSLYLQVRHDVCVNCNECAIAVACPAEAFCRVPAGKPALLKRSAREVLLSKARDLSGGDAAEKSRREVLELLDKDARETLDQRAGDG
jgi:electron transport complex protein RnfB